CMCLLLVLAGGCTQTDVEEESLPLPAGTKVDVGFRLNVLSSHSPQTRSITFTPEGTFESDTLAMPDTPTTLPTPPTGVGDSVRTKAAAGLSEEQENTIATLWVGQYEATSGKRLSNEYFGTVSDTKDILLQLPLNASGVKSHVYFIANAGDLGAVADEKTLKEKTLTCTTGAGAPVDNRCKMAGMWEGEVVSGGVEDIPVEMIRLMAKITFTYAIGGDGFTFTPTSVALKNAPGISRVEVTERQLPDISYNNYSGEANASGATMCWYLAENMAGTGTPTVDSNKKKIGAGVTNATCIELTGDAKQLGVEYKDVTFRFYPGADMNNYDIVRNGHYATNVTLVGIDLLDERITVGTIPPITVDPDNILAEGGEKTVAITTRPGQLWSFTMPDWLTALIGGKTAGGGSTVSDNKPYSIPFTAAVNPTADVREADIVIDLQGTTKTIHIGQNASTLTKGSDISLAAAADSEGSSSFTATKGLKWQASLSDWLDWTTANPAASGDAATGSAQDLKIKAASNPTASARTGTITVKAGASIDDASYTGLKQEIAVNQAASTASGSTINNIVAAGATGDATFTATKGLPWASTPADWITVNTGGTGTSTTGSSQTINYTVAVNPSSSVRSGKITVRAGDTSAGPTGDIVLNQLGATLSVSGATTLAATASTDNTSTFTATPGLSWNVGVTSTGNWLSLTGSTSGTENTTGSTQTITYSAPLNTGDSVRNGTITVKVGDGQGALSQTISVSQDASVYVGIDESIALTSRGVENYYLTGTEGLTWNVTVHSTNGITITPTSGTFPTQLSISVEKNPSTPKRLASITVNIPDKNYSQAVSIFQYGSPPPGSESGIQRSNKSTQQSLNWNACNSYCANLVSEDFDDWRLPSDTEMYGMWNGTSPYNGVPISGFWGSRTNGSTAHILYKSSASSSHTFKWDAKTNKAACRCVRTIL
ncbi:BACON domain-containing carbohydrate-binding protein, partial [uncultured Parabacteroides sp.]